MSSVLADQHGAPMSGSADAIAIYDGAIDRLLRFHPDVISMGEALTIDHPDVAMGHAIMAYLNLMSTDAADLAAAEACAASLRTSARQPREQLHSVAIDAWLAGDWTGSSALLDDILRQWPTDLLALVLGHQLDFFLGDARNLRDRVGRSLPELDPAHPHVGFVRGMQAFGYEEAGHYGPAEAAGLAALEANRDDVWAVHAVVHAYEMQGRVDDGLRFMRARESDWGTGNLFTVHNWWHLALYLLEAGDHAGVLDVYDTRIRHPESAPVPIELLDASAILWRCFLDDVDTGQRFAALADAWSSCTSGLPWYVFNHVHAVMALVGAGRLDDARTVIDDLLEYAETAEGTNASMTAEIGLPACEAVLAFGEGRYHGVIAELMPIRRTLHHFGGSHAQRDALQRTLLESALRGGELDLARALTAERLNLRDRANYNWAQRARVLRALGDDAAAASAAAQAALHQEQFADAMR